MTTFGIARYSIFENFRIQNLKIVLIVVIQICALFFLTFDVSAMADTVSAPKVFDKKYKYTWLVDDKFVVEQLEAENLVVVVFQRDEKISWKTNLGPNQRLKDVEKDGENLLLLLFERAPTTIWGNPFTSLGCNLGLIDCSQTRNRYYDGTYRLVSCGKAGTCNIVKTFEGGVSDIASDGKFLWASEFVLSNVIYGIEVLSSSIKTASLHKYSLDDFHEIYRKSVYGLTAIDLVDNGKILGLILATEFQNADSKRFEGYGIFDLSGEIRIPLGKYRPSSWSVKDISYFCHKFIYVSNSDETFCIVREPANFQVQLVKNDGSYPKSVTSRIFPARVSGDQILIADEQGQLIEVHSKLGGK